LHLKTPIFISILLALSFISGHSLTLFVCLISKNLPGKQVYDFRKTFLSIPESHIETVIPKIYETMALWKLAIKEAQQKKIFVVPPLTPT